ncbi:MAG TPA: diguanylate cyclase [Ramlibacter sp.]|uniref:sensor domain-containing diguanylate cyclase n=1 Tax=Ramlibacter sp. TaxID=1917967 RepID=UPI002C82A194|nr:diguanylate cyclase [Ramlibacter sp.]HVZ45098.1 diguanylate cyclase [Ramlibacter sp.]
MPQLRHAAVVVLAALLLAAAPAWARQILDLDIEHQPARLLDWGDYYIDPDGTLTLRQVLSRGSAFQPTLVPPAYRLRPGEVLWIKFAVPATPDDSRWYLLLPIAGLDSALLYTQTADGGWTLQASGDAVAVARWPIPHLHPVLPLAISAAEPSWYMLAIRASEGFAAPIEFVSDGELTVEVQRQSLIYGVCFGLLAMGALFALATSAVLRDMAYFWFGVWAAAASLALMAAVGVAGLHLWPRNPVWNDNAPYVLALASLAPLIVFVAESLLLRDRAPRLFALVLALAGCFALGALSLLAMGGVARLALALALAVVAAGAVIALTLWSRRHGNPFAPRLLLALAPMMLALPAYALALLQVSMRWLDSTPAVASLGLSASASYLLLALRSQQRRDHRRRIAQLAEIDPMTGLVNDAVFALKVRSTIDEASRFGHRSLVAVLDFSNYDELRREFGRRRAIELLLRLSDRLTSMLRNVDTLARLGDSRFGLLIEGPLAVSRARAFCAKVIARCIGPIGGLPQGMQVKPKIACALVPDDARDAQQVLRLLEEALQELMRDPVRNMAVAEPPSLPSPPSLHPPPGPPAMAPTQPDPGRQESIGTAPTLPGDARALDSDASSFAGGPG